MEGRARVRTLLQKMILDDTKKGPRKHGGATRHFLPSSSISASSSYGASLMRKRLWQARRGSGGGEAHGESFGGADLAPLLQRLLFLDGSSVDPTRGSGRGSFGGVDPTPHQWHIFSNGGGAGIHAVAA